MITLLARRGLAMRPVRTLFLLLGFALGGAVMVVLLSVGEAILEQARDVDLLGGGEIVILPVGIDLEAVKIGGLSAMFFRIQNARTVARSLLEGQRLGDRIVATSPQVADRVVTLRRRPEGEPIAVRATGTIPSRERILRGENAPDWADSPASEEWLDVPLRATTEMDAFHRPEPGSPYDSLWAEWHYFNLRGDADDP
ncbi:MAG: hypothetical protein GF346_01215, partial [Candidatus Eisenbacteria bacterium]|nr:hypothetical protein [Candidatus Latescibacterota bacterium]MBD3301049.1 hypothetical protein [Candidatus Eisenbacteria bacterium]